MSRSRSASNLLSYHEPTGQYYVTRGKKGSTSVPIGMGPALAAKARGANSVWLSISVPKISFSHKRILDGYGFGRITARCRREHFWMMLRLRSAYTRLTATRRVSPAPRHGFAPPFTDSKATGAEPGTIFAMMIRPGSLGPPGLQPDELRRPSGHGPDEFKAWPIPFRSRRPSHPASMITRNCRVGRIIAGILPSHLAGQQPKLNVWAGYKTTYRVVPPKNSIWTYERNEQPVSDGPWQTKLASSGAEA